MFTAVVEKIHASPYRFGMIVTGAGGSAVAALLAVPGCSKTLIDAHIPYAFERSERLLDHKPAGHVGTEVGRQLAQHAYRQCVPSGQETLARHEHVVGLGLTAAIATNRERKGRDAVYLSCWTHNRVTDYEYQLSKDMTRAQQESIAAAMTIKAMADFSGIEIDAAEAQSWGISDIIVNPLPIIDSPINQLLTGKTSKVLFNSSGEVRSDVGPFTDENLTPEDTIYLLYPGSFKPLHWGHTELSRVAGVVMQRYMPEKGRVVLTYEISTSCVGKKDVDEEDIKTRVEQFTSCGKRVALSNAMLFIDKAKMFRHHGLVVGVDTARRVIDPQYYGGSEAKMIEAILEIGSYGCYFIVGGRKRGDDWDDLSSVVIPEAINHLFKAINPSDFRVDISSTEIRERRSSMGSSQS